MPTMIRVLALTLACAACAACTESTPRVDDGGTDAGEPDYGRCGPEVYACVCAGAELYECLSLEPDCSVCLSEHAETCCGPESTAYYDCVALAEMPPDPCPPDDVECVNLRCATEAGALQGCLSEPRCDEGMAGCTGPWPAVCD